MFFPIFPVPHARELLLNILVAGETVYSMELTRPLELGRQRMGEAGPYAHIALEESDRVIIAELSESTISRRHVAVAPISSHSVCISNLSGVNTIWIDSSRTLETNAQCECELPVFLTLGSADLAILIYPSPDPSDGLQSLAVPTALPGAQGRSKWRRWTRYSEQTAVRKTQDW